MVYIQLQQSYTILKGEGILLLREKWDIVVVLDFLNIYAGLDECAKLDKVLPLVHTAPSRYAMKILKGMKLKRSVCNAFNGEKLLYFFYARPAYRKIELDTSKDKSLFPVVFLVDSKHIDIKRVYPFDSGAYSIYTKTHLSDFGNRSDYEILNQLRYIQLYIKAIFGNNQRYYDGLCNLGSELPDIVSSQREVKHDLDNLLNLIASANRAEIDDRCMTVEVQSPVDCKLSGKLLSVVVPSFYQNDQDFLKLMKKYGITPKYYKYFPRHRVNEVLGAVFSKVEEFYRDNNYF